MFITITQSSRCDNWPGQWNKHKDTLLIHMQNQLKIVMDTIRTKN